MFRNIKRYLTVPLAGYLILAGGMAYAVGSVEHESAARSAALAQIREERTDATLRTLAEGSVTGCASANTVTQGTHKVVVGAYNSGKMQVAVLVSEGFFSKEQGNRALAQAYLQTKKYLVDLPYRDCRASGDRYIKQIQNPELKASVETDILTQAYDERRTRIEREPVLKR